MKKTLKAYLDGEIPFEDLPEELREEARAWDRLFAEAASTEHTPQRAPAFIEERVMAEVQTLAGSGSARAADDMLARALGWLRWLRTPRTIRISPLSAGLIAAGVAALVVFAANPPPPAPPGGSTTATPSDSQGAESEPVYVQFSLEAPGASSVSLAGDFSDWEGRYPLEDLDGDGVWTARIPLEPGVHKYMFVVDDSEWVTDPFAERYVDDGFGSRNAVLALAAPMRES